MTEEEIREIAARHQAARYAQAISAAAGAEEKIKALEEALADAEHYRLLAEYQLDAITWPEGLGQVFHVGTEEPGEDTYALLDIYSGAVWRREKFGNESLWYRAEKEGPVTRYAWPMEETSGPYIRLKDDWYIHTLVRDAREADEQKRKIERELGGKPGYREDGKFGYPPVSDGVVRAYRNLQSRHEEAESELRRQKSKVEELERLVELYKQAEVDADQGDLS